MAIRSVVTRGFGTGSFNGTIPLVVTRGYAIAVVVAPDTPGLEYTAPCSRLHYTSPDRRLHYTAENRRLHYTAPDEDDR